MALRFGVILDPIWAGVLRETLRDGRIVYRRLLKNEIPDNSSSMTEFTRHIGANGLGAFGPGAVLRDPL